MLSLTWAARPFAQSDGFVPLPCESMEIIPLATLPNLPVIEMEQKPSLAQIHEFEDILEKLPTRVSLRNEYYFAPDVCLKSLRMPAGITATGKMHRTEHLSILAEGTMMLLTHDGWVTLTAPAVVHSKAGVKRIANSVTDCTFITVHATDETDIEKLDGILYMPDRPIEGELA